MSDKLKEATEAAKKDFIGIVKEKGGNAVINMKISYSNLSGSVAAVMFSGTAVKVEKNKGTMKEHVNDIAVSNYFARKIVRPIEVDLHIDNNQTYMSLKLHNYEMAKITAVKVDVEFTDIYGETTFIDNIDYTFNQDINILIETDKIPIDFDFRKVGLQVGAKVFLRKYVKDMRVVEVADQSIDSTLTSEELGIFKKNRGADAVDKYRKTDTYWRCICGAINLPGDTHLCVIVMRRIWVIHLTMSQCFSLWRVQIQLKRLRISLCSIFLISILAQELSFLRFFSLQSIWRIREARVL